MVKRRNPYTGCYGSHVRIHGDWKSSEGGRHSETPGDQPGRLRRKRKETAENARENGRIRSVLDKRTF